MGSGIRWALAIGAGVAGGWALRSLADSPEGAGVKLLEIGIKTKDRVSGWAAVERERLDDMLAEAHANIARESATSGKAGHTPHSAMRRGARLMRRENEHETIV